MSTPSTPTSAVEASNVAIPTKRRGGCGKGCLIGVLIVVALCAAATYLGSRYAGSLLRQGTSAVLEKVSTELLTKVPLPAQERAKLDPIIKRFNSDLRSGKISLTQGWAIAERIASGSFAPHLMSTSLKELYLTNSGLSADEKSAGTAVINQFIAGVTQKRIGKDQSDAILKLLTNGDLSGGNGRLQMKPKLSDSDIRLALERMQDAARSSGVAALTPNNMDLAGELQRAIDEGMRGQ